MTTLDPGSVPADDRGLLLGDGLFETVRLYGGRPFRLDRHLARLEHGAGVVGIPVPGPFLARIDSALARWGARDGSLRITLTRGSAPGLAAPPGGEPRLLIAVRPLPAGVDGASEGIRAVVRGRLDERALVSGLKTLAFLERIQALRLASEAGAEEALLRNSSDLLVEGSASNLLALRGKTLIAPGREAGALPGITREALLECAPGVGLSVEERGLALEELPHLSELFLSSSLREVAAVTRVEGRKVGSGLPGPVFRVLAQAFRETVRREVGV